MYFLCGSLCGLLLAALCGPLCGGPLLCGPLCGSSRRLLLAAFCSAFLRHSFSVICLSFATSAAVLSHSKGQIIQRLNRGSERKCVSHAAMHAYVTRIRTQEGGTHRGPTHTEGAHTEGARHTEGATHTRGARPTQETHRHAPTARRRWTLCVANEAASKSRRAGADKHTQDNTILL